MKKFALAIALFALPTAGLIGCGDGGNKIIEDGEVEPVMDDQMMQDYEEQMRSGQGMSGPGSGPGN